MKQLLSIFAIAMLLVACGETKTSQTEEATVEAVEVEVEATTETVTEEVTTEETVEVSEEGTIQE